MKTVIDLLLDLYEFPRRAKVYAYEGEFTGVVIVDPQSGEELGTIDLPPEPRDAND
jgi:hypothetical protein